MFKLVKKKNESKFDLCYIYSCAVISPLTLWLSEKLKQKPAE